MLHLPMKMIRKHELTKSNTNTADVTSAYRDDKQMQILSMLLLPMKMIENGSTANVTPAYEDDMKDADVTPAYEDDMEAADVTPAYEDDNQLNFLVEKNEKLIPFSLFVRPQLITSHLHNIICRQKMYSLNCHQIDIFIYSKMLNN